MNSTINEINFADVPQFSEKDIAYQTLDSRYDGFYLYPPTHNAFQKVIEERKKFDTNRHLLAEVLHDRYQGTDFHDSLHDRIDSLKDKNTFTITTAHQPVFLLGPLYFVYKIISTIRLCRDLSEKYPQYNFQPIFISGGEDHDFDEIATVHLFNKHFSWITSQTGSVGRMKLDGLREAIDEVIKVFGSSPFAEELKDIIESSFKQSELYSEFNFELVNRLFADHGLIVVNMDDRRFKEAFLPFVKRELLEEISSKEVRATQSKLEERGIKEQAHVRDINLFWINRDSRDRIVKVADGYKIGEDLYSEKDLLEKLESEPQNISPNVVMRPIFQELILPNLAYIGGGGEIAYWLERKSQFAVLGLPYPMLIRRNSALFVPGHVVKNIGKLGFKVTDFLKSSDELVKAYLDMHTEDDYNLGNEKDELRNIFKNLAEKSKSVDPTLAQYILAEGAKQEKVLDRISSKITKAAKEKNDVALNKISKLRDKIYPSGKLQERFDSFIPFYLRYGSEWFDHLLEILDPMNKNYLIIEES